MTRARDLSLAAAIFAWATILGGIVYSHIVWFPAFLSDLPKSAELEYGPYALHDDHFWLTIHPLAILSIVAALALNWKLPQRRKLIGISATIYALAIVATAIYFVPELLEFHKSMVPNVTPAQWYARGQKWQHMSWIRGAFMYAAFIPLLLAWRREVH